MSSEAHIGEPHEAEDLARVMADFSEIGASLVASYEALGARAERVEGQLAVANRELERKVSELDALHRDLEAILEALPTGVVVRDAAGLVVQVNRAATRILGVPAESLVGTHGHPALSGEHTDGLPRELQRPGGERLVLATRYAEFAGEDGRGQGSVEILDDRTEVTALTEKLHTLDKMAALGTMAGGIAHEIRNPLNAINGFAGLVAEQLAEDDPARRWAELIGRGARDIDEIITSMLTFARPEQLEPETIEAEALLAEALRLALPEAGDLEKWRVSTRCAVGTFVGDRIKLRQAIRNLISNSASVQPAGGLIEVECVQRDGQIVFCVDDAGPGVPPQVAARILDPFFTTRAEGTGLGLALTSSIARLHGGDICIHPEPSHLGGARISISFPVHLPR